jgi:hypothetical protein
MRYLKILFLSMAVIGLMAGSVFAAAIGNGTGPVNTAVTMATELVGTSAGLKIADTGEVYYKATNAFVANDVITFTFSNVTIYDGAFDLCIAGSAVSQADYIGAIDATNGVSQLLYRVAAAGIPAGQEVILVGGVPCIAEPAYTTGGQRLSVKFPQLTNGVSATVSAGAVFGTGTTIPGATATAVNLYTVQNQYSATATLTTDNIDFASDMKKIIVAAVPALLDTGTAFVFQDSAPAIGHTLVTSDKMDLTISGSMSGISRICWDDAACLSGSTTKFTINTGTNTATYSVLFATAPALTDFNGKAITFVVDGVTPLTERTFTVTGVMNLTPTDQLDRTLLSAAEYFKMALTTYQAICPFVKYNAAPSVQTWVRLTSSYISTGTEANKVKGTVLCGNGITSVVNLGQIIPGTTLGILASDILTAAGAVCIPDAVALAGFPVTFTVNAPAVNVSGVATMIQPEGMRAIPMKSNNAGFTE